MDDQRICASGGINYTSSITYAATGGVAQQTLGNGLIQKIEYNSRLQTTAIRLGTGADANSVLSLVNDYGLWNGSSVVTSQNNGNLGRATITPGTGQTPFVETYTYDQLNRLATATENKSSVQQWKQSFTFDQWGNRSVDTGNTTANVMPPALTYNTATNRITGPGVYGFDNAGNMTQDPLNGTTTYTFNADNRVTTAVRNSVTVGTYTYDGEGRRVKKTVGATVTRMVYNAAGELIAEYNGAGSLTKEYLSRGGEMIATVEPTNGTEYATADHLGTPRVWTNSVGQVVTGGRHDYLPFGEELFAGIGSRTNPQGYPSATQSDGQRNQFTSKERDIETNLDYFGARYYGSAFGRFVSVDPLDPILGRQGASDKEEAEREFRRYLGQPQHWNRYTYALNNPLRFVDPDGFAETLTVNLNIVYDKDANYTEEQKKQIRETYIANAKAVLGNVDIKFNVTETEGTAENVGNENKQNITSGSAKDAINVFVTDKSVGPSTETAHYKEGTVFINTAAKGSHERDLAHGIIHVLGIARGVNGYTGSPFGGTAELFAEYVQVSLTNLGRHPFSNYEVYGYAQAKAGVGPDIHYDSGNRHFAVLREGARRFLAK